MAVSFECITRARVPQAELFDRSRSIDAHTRSMARSRETAVAGTTTGLISLGQHVTWRARHFGVPIRMTSRITDMEAPNRFVDQQIRGPFRRFRHVHEFSHADGITTMTDRIEFAAPFGPLGRVVEKLVLARYLRTLIETRNRYLVEGPAHR
ncbi:SRPBCC family protein [Arthrobacter agilis]|uniref:SRPBCC family protein n=1 Tax=Arthrobacter agilis TaxID=37921 RepID=UPI00277D9E7D|nr:SRPBCC family protein [Arthrobacter agilis]MDQ0734128.1 ligand-binding SRPBCC domain-containing protein [Arthrobacter agilis]